MTQCSPHYKVHSEFKKENKLKIFSLNYAQMESIVEKMLDETTGVPVRTVKSMMVKIPSVFTGTELIAWLMKTLDTDDQGTYFNIRIYQIHKTLLTFLYFNRGTPHCQSIGSTWLFLSN